MLRISWIEHKASEFVRNCIVKYATVCQKIDYIKMKCFNHFCRRNDSCIEKIFKDALKVKKD